MRVLDRQAVDLGDRSIIFNRTETPTFDGIGNRISMSTNGRAATWTPNSVNQYTSRTVPGAVDIFGTANEEATVSVNGQTPVRQGKYFHQELPADNSEFAVRLNTEIVATNGGQTTIVTGRTFLPKTPESFAYDADGNLTADEPGITHGTVKIDWSK